MPDSTGGAAAVSKLPDPQRCGAALDELVSRNDGMVSLALLAYRDGRPYLFRGVDQHNAGKLAAMAGSMAALSHTLLREIDGDTGEQTILEGRAGKLVVVRISAAGNLLLLAVHARGEANLGLLLTRIRVCVQRVSEAFV